MSGRRRAGQNRPRTQGRTLANRDRRHQRAVGADEGVVTDPGGELVDAVIIAGNGASANIDLRPDHGVTQIAQMAGFAARADA